jgi:hypothetical protein
LLFSFKIYPDNIGAGYSIVQRYSIGVIFILFIAMRGFVETDFINYYPLYKSAPSILDKQNVLNFFARFNGEQAFYMLLVLCKSLSGNYFFLQIVSSTIDFFILYYFFNTYIPQHFILGFLFFFIFSGIEIEFNLLRNSKSIMLFLLSIKYIYKKNFLVYLLINIAGCFFHASSLIYLPLYFFVKKRISRILILILFLCGNIVFISSFRWMRDMLDIISNISSISNNRLFYLIHRYLSNEFYSRSLGLGIGTIERFLLFLLFFTCYNKLIKINEKNLIFLNIAFIYLFIFLYCSELYIIIRRVNMLFICSYWILFPEIYRVLKKELKYIFMLLLIMYVPLKMSFNNGFNAKYESVFNHSDYYSRMLQTRIVINKSMRNAI